MAASVRGGMRRRLHRVGGSVGVVSHAPHRRKALATGGVVLAIALAGIVALERARAADFVVNDIRDLADPDLDDGVCDADGGFPGDQCTLRAAIQTANMIAGADTIFVPPGTYALAIAGPGTDPTEPPEPPEGTVPLVDCTTVEAGAHDGDHDITCPVTITGAGPGKTIIDGGTPSGGVAGQTGVDRLFEIHPSAGNVLLSGMTIQGGWDAVHGGAIATASGGTVRLEDVVVSDSFATDFGGGIYAGSGTAVECETCATAGTPRLELVDSIVTGNTTLGMGGGMFVQFGSVAMHGSEISDNEAHTGGGIHAAGEIGETGMPSALSATGTTISGNGAWGEGGGIFSEGETSWTLLDSTVSDNTAGEVGGGMAAVGRSSLSITGGSFSGNSSRADGGGVYVASERSATMRGVSFTGNASGVTLPNQTGEMIVGGEGGGGAMMAASGGTLRVTDSTFAENTSHGDGGAIRLESGGAVTIEDSVIRDNVSQAGGGGLENIGGRVSLERLTIAGNRAALDGGGIQSSGSSEFSIVDTSVHGNVAQNGGGLTNAADGTLRVESSTFWDNRAQLSGAFSGEESGLGGGIYGLGDANASYENVTITGNVAQARGGGMYIDADGDVHVVSSTITGNLAPAGSGVGGPVTSINFPIEPSLSVVFRNTIVAGNLLGPQCVFAVGSEGGNLDEGDSCYFRGARDRQNAGDPGLDAVADNGGHSLTMAIREGSFAIDGGVSPCADSDQRGVLRPQNVACDMGALEYEGPFPPPDTEPPDTEYLEGPIQVTDATSIFRFTGSDNVTVTEELLYECRLLELDPTEPPEPTDPTEPVEPEFLFVGCPNPWEVPLVEAGEGQYTFEVRAIDRAGNVDPEPASFSFEPPVDETPPNTIITGAPCALDADPCVTTGTTAVFSFSGTDDQTPGQFMEYTCAIDTVDPEVAVEECLNPVSFSNLTVGEHTVWFQAIDAAGNADPTPARFNWTVGAPATCDEANITLFAGADSWIDESNTQENFGIAEELVVRSAAPGADARVLIRFPLPAGLEDCTLETAHLRLHAGGEGGRTLEAVPVDEAWVEGQVTWLNQPDATGTPAGTTSGNGYREWDITDHVAAWLGGTAVNNGWLVRDAAEEGATEAEQLIASRNSILEPPLMVVPQLVLRFEADPAPPPDRPAPPTDADEATVSCGQTIFETTRVMNDLFECPLDGLIIGAPNIYLDLNGRTIDGINYILTGQEDALPAGVRNIGHDNVIIANGTVQEFGVGVQLMAGTKFNLIEHLTALRNAVGGVELSDADDGRNGNIIRLSTFGGNAGGGVVLMNGSENSVIEDNLFDGNAGVGILVIDSRGNRIEGNTVTGVPVDPSIDSDSGMRLEGSTDNLILDNTLTDTGDAGIVLTGGAHRNRVEDNVMSIPGDAGVTVEDSDGTVVVRNVAHLAADAGIVLSGANHGVVSHNDVRFNPSGIVLEGSSANVIQTNDASYNLGSGISIASGSLENHILDNEVSFGRATGIAVEGGAVDEFGNPLPGNIISGNATNANLGTGISVSEVGHTVADNSASSNAAFGIGAAEGTIDGGGNTASGNGEAVQCTGVVCGPGTPVSAVGDITPPETILTSVPPNPSTSLDTLQFTFTGTDNVAPPTALRFECRLNAAPDPPPDSEPPEPSEPGEPPEAPEVPEGENWGPCVNPVTFHLMATDTHTFEVRAIDFWDNRDPTPAVYIWDVVAAPPGPDGLAPSTTIAEMPPDPSTTTTATFVFRGSDNATPGPFLDYQCSLDGTSFSVCTSPVEYTGLALGEHTFRVVAIDGAGNVDPSAAEYTWEIVPPPPDVTDPETTIDSGPDLTTVSTSATFAISSNEAGASFQCSLDGSAFSACTSPTTYDDLAVADHTFAVRAVDAAPNVDQTPAEFTWAVGPAPVPTAVTCGQVITQSTLLTNDLFDCLTDGLVIGADAITLDLDGHTIDGTGLGFGIRNDGFDSVTITNGAVREFDAGVQLNAGSSLNIVSSMVVQLNELAGVALVNADDGSVGSIVRHTTSSGNGVGFLLSGRTQHAWLHDNLVGGSPGQGIRLEHSDANRIEANHLTLTSDAAIVLDGSSDNTLVDNLVEGASDAAFIAELGSHGNRIEGNTLAESEAGIVILDSNRNEIVDNVANSMGDMGISLENAHDGSVFGNDVRFNSSGIGLSGSTGNLIEGNDASEGSNAGISLEAGSLDNEIVLNDVSFNSSEGIYVGDTAPAGSGNLIDRNTANGNSADGIAVIGIGHIIANNEASNNGGWGIASAEPVVSGFNIDGGGNEAVGNGELLQCQNIVCNGDAPLNTDRLAPNTWIVSGPPEATTSTSASFRFGAIDDLTSVTFECRIDSSDVADFAPCTSPTTYTGLTLESHTFEVRAVDWMGNIDPTPAAHAWSVDPLPPGVAPDTFIDSAPDLVTASTTASFAFSSNEEGATFDCSLDGADFAPCGSPADYAGPLAVGSHTFVVRARDAEPNVDATPASHTWTVAAPPGDAAVGCGQALLVSTRLTNGLTDCSDGLVIAADGIIVDLNGHTIDGTGLGVGIVNNGFDRTLVTSGTVQEFDFGVQLNTGSAFNILSSLVLQLNQEGSIQLTDADGSHVRDNDLIGEGARILLTDVQDGVVSNNSTNGGPAEGIYLLNSSSSVVEGNAVTAASGTGLLLEGSSGNTVSANEVTANSGDGIALMLASNDNVVEGNLVSGNSGGILVDGSNGNLVAENVVTSNDSGISLSLADGNAVRINEVRLNAGGIDLADSSNNVVETNLVSANAGAGIGLTGASLVNVIATNMLGGNGEGISAAEPAPDGSGNLIEGNIVTNSASDGIYAAAGHTLTGNTANYSDGWGIFAEPGVIDGGGNAALGNAEPGQCSGIVCIIGVAPGAPDTFILDGPNQPVDDSRNAHFVFTATDDTTLLVDMNFECRLDSSDPLAWLECEPPAEQLNLAAGPHTMEIRAVDLAGNVDPTPAVWTWEYVPPPSGVAPDTTIELAPPLETRQLEATFRFSSNEPDVTFECSIDGGPFELCANEPEAVAAEFFVVTYAFDETQVGEHTFQVRAIDIEGLVDPSPATHTWTIVGIITTITNGPAFIPATGGDPAMGGEWEETSATFEFFANVAEAEFLCSLDLAPLTECFSPITYTGLAVGEHEFVVHASSEGFATGLPAEYEWAILPAPDTNPPNTFIDSAPADGSSTTTFTFSGVDDVTAPAALLFECRLDSTDETAWVLCVSPFNLLTELQAALAPGLHTFEVRAIDASEPVDPTLPEGNIDPSPASYTWTSVADDEPPTVEITSGPPDPTLLTDVTFTFAGTDNATPLELLVFECVVDEGVDGATFETCESPYEVQGMLSGEHILQVRATDLAGNIGAPDTDTWTVLGPPTTTILTFPPAETTDLSAEFTFTADQSDVSFACSIDGLPAVPCTSPAEYDGLLLGEHQFAVQATNASGLVEDPPASYEWSVIEPGPDVPPETGIFSGPAAVTASTDATFVFTANKVDVTFTCTLDGVPITPPCESGVTFTGLSLGSHTFEVFATDSFGNSDPTPATHAWTIDTSIHAVTVACGQVITLNTVVQNSLANCPGDGLVIGAAGLTLDLGGNTLDGDAFESGEGLVSAGIRNHGYDSVTVTNGTVSEFGEGVLFGFAGDGTVAPDGVVAGRVSGLTLQGNISVGLHLVESSMNLVEHNAIDGLLTTGFPGSDSGILLEASSTNTLFDNAVSNTGDAGVVIRLGSNGNLVDANVLLLTGDAGIFVTESNDNELAENSVRFVSDAGIAIDGALGGLIRENDVRFNPGGIELVEATGILIRDNDASDASGNGIALEGGAVDNHVLLNIADRTEGHGIYVAAEVVASPGNLIEDNTAHDNLADGIHVATAGHTITDNTANDNFGWGIFAAPGNTDGGDNDATGNGQLGQCSGVLCNAALVAPTASVTSGPADPTTETSATFIFSASEPATFTCRLDAGAPLTCDSPHGYVGLGDGDHTFVVEATDSSGDTDTAAWVWTVDTTGPTTTIESGPPDPSETMEPTFTLSASEPFSTFECSVDGLPFDECDAVAMISVAELGDHTFQARSIDPLLNVGAPSATYTWTVVDDMTPPDTQITSGPSGFVGIQVATLEFTGTDAGTPAESLEFECALDDEPFTSCSSPYTIQDVPHGEHTFHVRAIDLAAVPNVDPEPATRTWTVIDTVPPETTIDSGPASSTTDTTATFEFSSSEDGSTFECSFDSAAFAGCTSPHDVTDLEAGDHSFSVRAIDPAGNDDESAAVHAWAIHNTPVGSDVTVVTESPDGATTATVTFDAVDSAGTTTVAPTDGAVPDGYQLGGQFYDVETTATFTGLAIVCLTYEPADFPDGDATLLHFVDGAWVDVTTSNDPVAGVVCGEVATLSPFGVAAPADTTPPQTTISSAPTSPTTSTSATFGFAADEPGSTFACSLDDAEVSPCTSSVTYSSLAVGSHMFAVRASDVAGNADSSPAVHTWTVEVPPPPADCGTATTLTASADAWINQDSPSSNKGTDSTLKVMSKSRDALRAMVQFSIPAAPDGCIVESASLRLYAGSYRSGRTLQALQLAGAWTERGVTWNNQPPTTGAAATTTSGSGWRAWDVSPQLQAIYDAGENYGFLIRDAVETNDAEQQFYSREKSDRRPTLVITFVAAAAPDTTPPDTTVSGGPEDPTTSTSAGFELGGSDETTDAYSLAYQCALDGAAFADCTSPSAYSGLTLGSHTFQVRAVDQAGNVDPTPASRTWMVEAPAPDTTAPETTITSGPPATTTSDNATFAVSASESGSTFECALDAAFVACSIPVTYSGLAVGGHEFAVRATDPAGNTDDTPSTYAWTVETPPLDTTAPETTIDSGPEATTTSADAAIAFSANEPDSTFECALDGATFAACASPAGYSGLALGAHRFEVRAFDQAGNADATPATLAWTIDTAPTDCGSATTLTASADAWIDQASSSQNKGDDSSLKVRSKGPSENMRALVGFTLPAIPLGCEVSSATLRLYSDSPKDGRTLEAVSVAGSWTESTVTWSNQPATTGAAATTTSGGGWREWSVAAQLQAMYDAGASHGFLIRDATEGQDSEQSFHSREKGESRPELVLTFGAPADSASIAGSVSWYPTLPHVRLEPSMELAATLAVSTALASLLPLAVVRSLSSPRRRIAA